MREDARWYVSPDGTYGCWIVNESDRHFLSVFNNTKPAGKSYRSAVPLHNHKTQGSLKHHVCWYINESGTGQYGLLINGKIKNI